MGENTRHTDTRSAHAIVIGSGFGGLAAAVRLGARGYRVTVLEKLDAPGGRGYVYRQDGFTFDAGPTIITAPFLLEELWTLCGKSMSDDIELRAIDPYYRIRFSDGSTFDYNGNTEHMHREICRFNPADVKGYEKFLRISQRVYAVGFDQLLSTSFDTLWKMIRVLPSLAFVQFYRSVYGLVSRCIKHPKLRQVFSFHPLLIGGNPFTTTGVYTLIAHLERRHGVHFAMGGTGRVIEGIVSLIKGQGGTIRYHAPVSQILIENKRAVGVELDNGERLSADIVVSNADSAYTYKHLVPAAYRQRWTNRKLKRAKYSMSLFVWYFGTDKQYHDVPHHMIMLGERYKGLLSNIFDAKVLSDDFSLYLHRPTKTDPSLAPEGCDNFYVLAPVPHLESGTDWDTEAEKYRLSIEQFLSGTVLPELGDHIVTSRMLTPADFKHRLNSIHGAAFSLQPTLLQTGWFRPHNRAEDIEHLYLVGAGTHPGAGIPGVVSSARVLDEVAPNPEELLAENNNPVAVSAHGWQPGLGQSE